MILHQIGLLDARDGIGPGKISPFTKAVLANRPNIMRACIKHQLYPHDADYFEKLILKGRNRDIPQAIIAELFGLQETLRWVDSVLDIEENEHGNDSIESFLCSTE